MEDKLVDIGNNGSVGYSAEIQIDIVKNGRTIKSTKTHNTGTVNLFQYIVEALAKSSSDGGCPFYLMGYELSSGTITERTDGTADGTVSDLGDTCMTNLSNWDNVSLVYSYDTYNKPYATVEYQFLIPGSGIIRDCNVIAIYSTDNATTYSTSGGQKPSMYAKSSSSSYYILKDDVDYNGANVIITWKLKINNNT